MINDVDSSGRGAIGIIHNTYNPIGKEDFLKVIAYHKMIQQTSDEEDIRNNNNII